jgi:hypothetical protein
MGTRLILFPVMAMIVSSLRAQNPEEGERGGLLQATVSLYPSWMLNHDVRNNYVAGRLVYYTDDHYAFRGEALVYVDAQTENRVIDDHLQIQAGFGRHFPLKRWDPYVYGQMGLAGIRTEGSPQRYYQPAVGIIAGANYHVSRFFYFFAECSYSHMQDPQTTGNLDQLFVSAGLGLQLPTKRM